MDVCNGGILKPNVSQNSIGKSILAHNCISYLLDLKLFKDTRCSLALKKSIYP